MIECRYILNNVAAEYAKKTTENEFLSEIDETFRENDEKYSALKYELRAFKIDRQKAEFLSDAKKVKVLSEKIAETEKRLAKLSLNPTNAAAKYDCDICRDTGFADGKFCRCYIERTEKLCYDFLEVKNFAEHRFSDDEFSKRQGFSPIYSKMKNFVDKVGETDKSVLLFGQKGTGKTFLAECVTNAVTDRKLTALMISAFDLNNVFIKLMRATPQERLISDEILSTCDLLVIDDLGAEPVLNKITAENFTAVISHRSALKKPFLITTNLNVDEISLRYGERLFSRLYGKNVIKIPMDGEDLRIK